MQSITSLERHWMGRRVQTNYGGGSVIELELIVESDDVYLTVDHDDGNVQVYDMDDLTTPI